MKLSIVIPCFNSEHSIEKVVERVKETLEDNPEYNNFEIICIDDCSKDNTLAVIKSIASKDRRVKVISLTRNFGQHSALMAGFRNVDGDIIVCLDDDGQNPPEEIIVLIEKLSEGYDLVSAKYVSRNRSIVRELGSRISMMMSVHLVGMPKGIELNSFCCFKRFVCDEVIKYDNPYPFVHGLMLRVTRNIANVEMIRQEREIGESGYSIRKLIALWLNGFTAFSVKPLRLSAVIGAVSSIIGVIACFAIIVKKLIDPAIPAGYSSMMAFMLLFFGFVMMFLGLIGEYLGRVYISLNNAPQYCIREKYNISNNSDKERRQNESYR